MSKLTRRDFLNLSAMSAAGVLAAACAQATPEIIEKEVTREVEKDVIKEVTKEVEKEVIKEVTKEVVKEVEKVVTPTVTPLNEAPEFRGLVAAGQLAPLEERIPMSPKVRDVVDGIGTYGGTNYREGSISHVWEMYALHVNNEVTEVFPEMVESWEFDAPWDELTLHYRKGMKWSDGEPFTVDDILFWWEEEAWNEELSPQGPRGWWKVFGEWTEFIKVDDFTIKLKFPTSYRPALAMAANYQTLQTLFHEPRHFMERFHIGFNPQANELAAKEGYEGWWQAYSYHKNPRNDTSVPQVSPYMSVEIATDHQVWNRNPCAWEVDPEGNQLPYIDQIYVYVGLSREMAVTKAAAGELTTFIQFMPNVQDIVMYKENAEQGGYEVREWVQSVAQADQYAFNQNHKDPVLREIFQDVRFRRAMSLAIDREEMNDIIYFGKGTVIQSTVNPMASYYKEEWGNAYVEYDPDRANELLDEIGLEWDSERQWRLRPDGQRLAVTLQFNERFNPKVMELVKEYWEAVGMQVEVRAMDGGLYNQRGQANELDLGTWHSDRMEELKCYMPQATKFNPHSEMHYAREWETWFRTEGKEGEEPPQRWKDQYLAMDRWYTASTEEDYQKLAVDVWQFFSDELVNIGTIGYPPQPAVIKNGLKNVPQFAYRGDGCNHLKTVWMQTWYWEK